MGSNTIVSAQMGLADIIKPAPNFEDVYQGLDPTQVPIALPGTRDFRAGDRGYDPNLLAGIPIPLGSRLLLWLPQFIINEGVAPIPYRWRVLWRIRTPEDQNQALARESSSTTIPKGLQGHLAGPSQGVPADGGVSGDQSQERIIMPASINSVAYEQTEPASLFDIADLNLHHEEIVMGGQSYAPTVPPVVAPGTNGIVSQGVYPADGDELLTGPTFLPYQTDAFGDEWMLLLHREDGGGAATTWDFQGQDRQISALFGTDGGNRAIIPGLGVYAFQGSGAT